MILFYSLIAAIVLFCQINYGTSLTYSSSVLCEQKYRIWVIRHQQNALYATQISLPCEDKVNDKIQQPFLALAKAVRETSINSTEAVRVFHGRGGCYEGHEHITLDWFPPVWLVTSHHIDLSQDELATIQKIVEEHSSTSLPSEMDCYESSEINTNFVYQYRSKNSKVSCRVLSGSIPEPHVITENGMRVIIKLLQGQNQGIFLDMKNGREWVRRHAKEKKVLNLFSYSCLFSVAALLGGASEVINVDMARGCLKLGQKNHELNGLTHGARFLAHDIFKTWGKIRKLGPYGLIVIDPPSFQKNSFVAKMDYKKIIRRVPDFLLPGGLLLVCLNAPELDSTWLKEMINESAPELLFLERLEYPISFPAKDSERALKVVVYKKGT